jgi:hypothetical protein
MLAPTIIAVHVYDALLLLVCVEFVFLYSVSVSCCLLCFMHNDSLLHGLNVSSKVLFV